MAKRPSDNSEKEPPSRNLGLAGHTDIRQIVAAGARKEGLKQRAWKPAAFSRRRPYAELHAASAFSFLEGASLPEDLIAQAAEFELPAVALVDQNRTGYKNLCRLITAGALGKPKGETSVTLDQIAAYGEGLHCTTGGEEGPIARALE